MTERAKDTACDQPLVLYTCDMDDFATQDFAEWLAHQRHANRHIQNPYWKHGLIIRRMEKKC